MDFEPGYKKLEVYLKSEELVILIYKITRNFPKDELFGLVSQMRRCSVSIPANIAEGYGRRTTKDKLQFYFKELKFLHGEIGKLLFGLIKSLSK